MTGGGAAGRLIYARTPGGEPVAECELEPGEVGLLAGLVSAAAAGGAALLWVHSTADLSGAGFERRHGYRRLVASAGLAGEPLPVLDTGTVLELMPRAFVGQWGHHEFNAEWAASAGARYVGLGSPGSWSGLCRAEPAHGLIDGPGFVGGPGTPEAVRRLVLGAAACLRPGPVTVETWGEPADPYLELGFSIAEECGGWERSLIA